MLTDDRRIFRHDYTDLEVFVIADNVFAISTVTVFNQSVFNSLYIELLRPVGTHNVISYHDHV